jgi:chemotaxis protein methyltransferase CheR
MIATIPEHTLSCLSDFVAHRFGLDFPRERWQDLTRIVSAAHDECRSQCGLEEYIRLLVASRSTQQQLQSLIRHMMVGETYFCREKAALESLSEHIVPEVLQRRDALQQIRIWSAGCATGEEPYSVAIWLSKTYPDLGERNVTILATDLNVRSLEKAAEGAYGKWSFRGAPEWLRNAYFETMPGGRWRILPSIRKMVSFRWGNLLQEDLDGGQEFDVILCRNVLMYFTSDAMKKVVLGFHKCLSDGGYLIVGVVETSPVFFPGFAPLTINGLTIYRKQSSGKQIIDNSALISSHPVRTAIPVTQISTMLRPAIEGKPYDSEPSILAGEQHTERGEPPSASYQQALALYRRNKYQDAEQMCTTLLAKNEGDPLILLLLARIYANLGKLAAALDCCQKALAVDKMAAPVHYLRALVLEEQGEFEDAALSLKRSIYVEPKFVLGHFALGNLALRHRSLGDPGKHFENALLLLAQFAPEESVPESEGLSVGELRRIVLKLRAKSDWGVGSRKSSSTRPPKRR